MLYGIILPPILFGMLGLFIYKNIFDNSISLICLPEIWLLGTASYVIPVVFFNLLFGVSLQIITYSHIIISLSLFIYFIYSLIRVDNFDQSLAISVVKNLKWYQIVFFIICMLILYNQLILPLRGWDSLNIYLPNAVTFFITDNIGIETNYLTFFPLFKAPVNSLLFTYSLYFTAETLVTLYPAIFFIMTAILIIKALEYFKVSKVIQFNSASIYLLSPFTFVHLLEFSYYQDHILGFYYGLAMIIFLDKKPSRTSYFLGGLSAGMAILSKISGYTIILVMCFIILKDQKSKNIRIGSFTLFFLFFILQSFSKSYLQLSLAIIILGIIVWNISNHENKSEGNIDRLPYLIIPTIVGIFWIIRLLEFPEISTNLYHQYIQPSQFRMNFYSPQFDIYSIYFENSQKIDSLNIIFVLILNYMFIPFFAIFKIIGFRRLYQNHSDYIVWFILFFIFWLTYHAPVSMRYLNPIIVPLFISIGLGIESLSSKLKVNIENAKLFFSVILMSGPLFYYSFIPISNIFQDFHQRFFLLQNNLMLLLIYILVMTVLYSFLLINEKKIHNGIRSSTVIATTILLILILSGYQTSIVIRSGYDLDQGRQYMVYDNRPAVREITEFLTIEFSTEDDIGIGYNVPGFALNSNIPIIDILYSQGEVQFSHWENETLDGLYQQLLDNNLTFIITLESGNAQFLDFNRTIQQYYFFKQPTQGHTDLLFINDEFAIWKLKE